MGGVWIGLITAAAATLLLVVFIAQNTTKASIHFLGFSGQLPVGLITLIAAIVGIVLAAIPGSFRILQLRRAVTHVTTAERRTSADR